MRRLSHPAILKVYDFKLNEDEAYLVTEFARAGSLQNLIHPDPEDLPTPLPVEQAANLLERIASALDYLHNERLAHRDLKPANILLLDDTHPVIAEVSLALPLNSQTPADIIKAEAWGTPLYAAPEIWDDRAGRASDIYSLGVMLYELLTGYTPYSGTPDELKEQHRNAVIPKLADAPSGLSFPQPLENLIAETLSKAPTYRPRSAGEVYRRFRASITPVTAPAPTIPATSSSYQMRLASLVSQPLPPAAISQPLSGSGSSSSNFKLPSWISLIIGIPLVFIVLIAGFGNSRSRPNPTPYPYFTPTPRPTPTIAYDNSSNGTVFIKNAYSSSIAGTAWSHIDPNTFYSIGEGTLRVWHINGSTVLPDSQEPLRLGTSAGIIVVSPDGKNIAIAITPDATSENILLYSSAITLQTVVKNKRLNALDVSSSGVLATATSNQIDFWDVNGGTHLNTLNLNMSTIGDVEWSPDGQTLAVSVQSQVQLWSKEGQLLKNLTGPQTVIVPMAWSPDGKTLAAIGRDDTLILWQRDGTLQKILTPDTTTDKSVKASLENVAFSPDGRLVLAAGAGKIYRWDANNFTPLKPLQWLTSQQFTRLAFSADGEHLLTASSYELGVWPKSVWNSQS